MSNLDMTYIADLIHQAQDGDSNAFAEFYAATYRKQYEFACRCLGDSFLAVDALQETYSNALRNLSRVRDALLSVPWLTQYNIRSCMEIDEKRKKVDSKTDATDNNQKSFRPEDKTLNIDGQEVGFHRVMSLPFTESQCIILHWHFGMSYRETASLLELKKREVRRYITRGCNRLKGVNLEKEETQKHDKAKSQGE